MENEQIRKILWKVKAIEINTENPYILTSGDLSPIYIDCRKIISYPEERKIITKLAWHILRDIIGIDNIDVIAGGEVAGIPFAAWLAQKANLPMIYVRKKAKGHGKQAQMEGVLQKGQNVLLVEDLITDGRSKENFFSGLKKAGANLNHCIVLFDREQGGESSLVKHGIKLYSMDKIGPTLEYGLKKNIITKKEFEEVKEYISNPQEWSKHMGFRTNANQRNEFSDAIA